MSNIDIMKNWIQEAKTEAKTHLPIKLTEIQPRTYDMKLVAWIDVLGMRNKIREKNAEEVFTCMEQMQDVVVASCDDLEKKGRLSFLQISDGFALIADPEVVNEFCSILCVIQWTILVNLRMLVRGAMTAGKVKINEDLRFIVGPALIDAFALEDENAIYPRILFSNDIAKHLDDTKFIFKHLKKDCDAFMYLDFMQHMIDNKKITKKTLKHLMETEGVISFLAKEYDEHVDKNKNIAQKYGWMISRFADLDIKIKVKEWRDENGFN